MARPEFLFDTNVVIGLLAGRQSARDLVVRATATPGRSAVSQITRMELLSFWALTDDEAARINELLSAMTVLPIDEHVERAAIALRRRTRLKLPDAIVAATAEVHQLQLLTLDERLIAALKA